MATGNGFKKYISSVPIYMYALSINRNYINIQIFLKYLHSFGNKEFQDTFFLLNKPSHIPPEKGHGTPLVMYIKMWLESCWGRAWLHWNIWPSQGSLYVHGVCYPIICSAIKVDRAWLMRRPVKYEFYLHVYNWYKPIKKINNKTIRNV